MLGWIKKMDKMRPFDVWKHQRLFEMFTEIN